MKRKVAKMGRLRLSPNEEAQLIKEEHERRRKLRLQQVREQERYIALQIRKEVQNRRDRELQNLEEELREEWQRQQKERLQTLEKQYQDCLRAVGEGHRSAKENEPDLEALAQKAEEQHERAAERHREALRELKSRRQRQQEEQTRHIQARRKALLVEKERAAKVASLPPPPPEPFEKIDAKRLPPVKMTDVDNFSVSHFIMPETAVEREEDMDQPDARRAAEEEARRLVELGEEEERERREQLAKARLRGNHALRKEHLNQDRERLLQELARMQQADLLRRRRAVAQMPPQSFQSFYGKREIREDRQRELEFAFEDMYSGERRMKGDLVLQLVPEPLPAVSADARDDDLDVTLEPEVTPAAEQDAVDRRSPLPPAQMRDEPAEGAPPHALRKLLNKIRTQKSQWCRRADGEKAADSMTIESGSIASEDRVGRPPPVPTNLDHLQPSQGQETTEETIVAGTLLPTEEQVLKITAAEAERRKREEELEQQKREQIELLERLEEQRRTLELHLQQAQQEKEILQTAVEVNVQQEVPEREQEAPGSSSFAVRPEMSTEPLSSAEEGAEEHLTKVRQYQQRLLDQSRHHKQSLEEARRRLAEYQHTLKMRYPRAPLTTGLNPAGFQNVPPLQAGLPLAPATGLLHGPCVSTEPSSAARQSPPSTLAPQQGLAEALRPAGSVSVPCPPLHPQSGDIHTATETPSSTPTREPSRVPPAAPLPFTASEEWRNLLLIEPARERQAETPREDSRPPSRVSPPVAPVYQDPKAPSLEPVLAEPHGQPDRPSPTPLDPSPGLDAGPLPCAAEMEAQRQELQEAQQRVEAQRKAFHDQQRAQEERLLLQQDQLREQMRRQREALDAFLSEAQAEESPQPDSAEALEVSRAERLSLVSTLLRAIEESNGSLAPPQSTEPPSHSLQNQADVLGHVSLSSDAVSQADPPSKVPAPTRAPKPPLARPRLGILEILEQHELSAIQEVETPIDASLVTVGDDSVEASCPWPEAAEEPDGPSRVDRAESRASRGSRGGQSSGSDPGSGSGVGTGRSSRLSWRDRLQQDMESSSEQGAMRAAGSLPHLSSDNTQDVLTFPGPPITSVTADEEGRVSPFCSESRYTDQTPECLSSFTISTGSFSTNEPDLSSAAINASTLSAEATGRGGVSTPTLRRSSSSSSSNGGVSARLSPASESVLDNSNIQRIIDKYTRELNVSLASVGKRSGGPCSAETSPATPRVVSDSGESSSSPSLSRATVEGPSLAFGHDISSVHSYQETTQTFHGSSSGLYLQDPHGGLGGRGFMETLEDLSKSSFDGTQNSSCRFLPLEPRPDFDSSTSTSSSSRRSERQIQIRGAEEWDVAGRRTGQLLGQSTPQYHTEGRDSNMSRLIGHLPDQTTSHWLKERSDFTTRQAIGPPSDDPTEQLLGEVTSEWGEVSSGQSSQRLGGAQSSSGVEYGGPAHPFQFPNTAPVPGRFLLHPSTSLPMCDTQEATPTFTQLLSQRTGQDMSLDSSKLQDTGTFQQTSAVDSQELEDPSDGDRTLVDPSSDSFHPLLAEVTQNEAAELSVTFHPPVQDPDSPCGSDVTLHAELPSTDLSGGVTDPNSTLEPPPSPEHLRAEAQDLSLCPLPSPLGSLCQLAESLCGSQTSVSMESLSREDGHLAGHHLSTLAIPEVPSLALPPERACSDEGAEAVALASGKRAAKATDGKAGSGSTPSQPVWERLLEVSSGEGILEEPELSLMELTKSTMQELSLAEEEEEVEKEAQSEAREAFGEQLCKAVSLLEDGGGSKLESVPSHAVMQLEFQWRAGDLQQALLQKRQDFIQRSARRLEELRTRQEEKRKSPHVSRPKVAPQSQRSRSRSHPQPQGGGELKKVGEVRVCAPEHRKMEEAQMYQRTERLYNQLEEVKQRKEMRLRQESYAKNREKAKEFQKKTLQKLRAKQAQR